MKKMTTFLSVLLLSSTLGAMPALAEPAAAAKPSASNSQSQAPMSSMVNINTADAATLADRLNGVGQKKAEAIVSYREQHGPFKSVEGLLDVTGIGEATLEKNRALLTLQ